MKSREITALEDVLGHRFVHPELLDQALTHSSQARGLEAARPFILAQVVAPELERIASNGSVLPVNDYKSALQEKLQATGRPQPQYVLVKERGPEHNKTFTVEARLQSREAKPEFIGRAEGSTKKNAEQDAARQVLEYLASRPEPVNGDPRRVRSRS